MARILINSLIDTSALRAVRDKLLLFGGSHQLIMITDVKVTEEEVTYGRKKNKTKKAGVLYCTIYGYNCDGEFIGTFDDYTTERYLRYDLLHLRKNYLEMKKRWEAMHALEEKINEPDFVKAIP